MHVLLCYNTFTLSLGKGEVTHKCQELRQRLYYSICMHIIIIYACNEEIRMADYNKDLTYLWWINVHKQVFLILE